MANSTTVRWPCLELDEPLELSESAGGGEPAEGGERAAWGGERARLRLALATQSALVAALAGPPWAILCVRRVAEVALVRPLGRRVRRTGRR